MVKVDSLTLQKNMIAYHPIAFTFYDKESIKAFLIKSFEEKDMIQVRLFPAKESDFQISKIFTTKDKK